MLSSGSSYEEISERFQWSIPEFYNIGVDVCDRWAAAEPERAALIYVGGNGSHHTFSYCDMRLFSNKLANSLAARGVHQGDRIGILLPQAPETAWAHIATYKMGAIAVPLFSLFGPEALEYRLRNARAKALITNADGLERIRSVRDNLPDLAVILSTDGADGEVADLHAELSAASSDFEPANTKSDDPALIIYTSGTTGMPKGALHAHRVLLGHLPGVEMSHDFLPQTADRIWTPAEWAWIGGLLDVLLPALHHGVPVVAHRFPKFSGEAAFQLIRELEIRNAFIPPTALKMMRAASLADPSIRVSMRSVASGGESLGSELLSWGRDVLGVTINEFYGQTECNMIVSSCGAIMTPRPGVMGRAVPGHDVRIIDENGQPCDRGAPGIIGVRSGDPVMFLGYWENPEATNAKYRGDWLLTGDIGVQEEDGWLRFIGRDDDIITSSGYRIGPSEIEDCLLQHPAVQIAAVVGKPDPQRTEIVKAYVVLKSTVSPSDKLKTELSLHVKEQLGAHEYPREITFVPELPMTATGKVIRRELRDRTISETKL
jgi:acetyl-CoA synthetase